MSPSNTNQESAIDDVRQRLEALPGIVEADLSSFPERVSVRVAGDTADELLSRSITELLRAESGVDTAVRIEIAPSPGWMGQRRARFEGLHVTQPAPGWLSARVQLDWKGEVFTGESDGEFNLAGELRICASAALRAVERITASSVTFSLVGVKEVRVFDHDLVVVLIHTHHLAENRLIGNALITDSRRNAAARAALNATNRVIGKYIG